MSDNPRPKDYESAILSFLLMVKQSKTPEIHKGTEPAPSTYGISEHDAQFIRFRVQREIDRRC